jgi:MoxR-like ATPase
MSDAAPLEHPGSAPPAAAEVPEARALRALLDEVGRVVVGQRALLEGLLIALLAGGHVLVEGVPGLAKTTAVRALAQALGLGFRRVQFTPDLLPGDLIGTPIYLPDERRFAVRKGPIFSPVLLADEINRAPAKVQSALLEAMEERQVTIGDESFALPRPFFVMATQNPIEHEGTYPLPEAQVDRFLLKLVVGYPSAQEELVIAARADERPQSVSAVADAAAVEALRAAAAAVHVADPVADYAVRLVRATRDPAAAGARVVIAGTPRPATGLVAIGASPRASLFLLRAARARAFLDGRDFATPHDVKRVAPDVLRHRILLTYEAEADGVAPEAVVEAVLAAVPTP